MSESITPRRFVPALSPEIPRHWLPGNEVVSSLLNAYTILVPANEAFYIRTLKASMPSVRDPALQRRCVAFIHQEAQHGVAHVRYWTNLEAQGYRFRGFERNVERWVFKGMEKVAPLWLRASLVSAVEHINAYVGLEFLSQRILADAHPSMKDLMEWHFAEEIEHRAVAFDLLQAVSPRYAVRVLGFVMTVGLFYALTAGMATAMLAQDRHLWRMATLRQLWAHLGPRDHMAVRTVRHLVDYLRPGFHPSQMPGDALAAEVLRRQAETVPATIVPTQRGQASEAQTRAA